MQADALRRFRSCLLWFCLLLCSPPATAADPGLPPFIRLDTADQTLTAAFHSASGIDPASVRLLVDGVDRTQAARHDDKTLSYTLPEERTFATHSVRLQLKDKQGQRGVAQVSATHFGPPFTTSGTVVSYFLPRREKTRILVCLYGNETPQRTFSGWHGPGEVAVPWDGMDDGGSKVDAGIYMFYVEARRGKHWVRIAAIDPLKNPQIKLPQIQHPQNDAERLTLAAARAYPAVPAQAVRRRGGREEFLFLSLNPRLARHPTGEFEGDGGGGEAGQLLLASRDARGKFAILWRYDLPADAEDAVWWDAAPGQSQDAIAVQLTYGGFLTLRAVGDEPPVPWAGPFDIPGEENGAPLRKGFWVRPDKNKPALLLGGQYRVSVIDLAARTAQVLWSTPKIEERFVIREEGFPRVLAVGDLDGRGGLELVAYTDRTRFSSGKMQTLEPTLRVWRYDDGRFREVCTLPTPGFVADTGAVAASGAGAPALIALNRFPADAKGVGELAGFCWNGTLLQEVTGLRRLHLRPEWDRGSDRTISAADLDGDGIDELMALTAGGKNDTHLQVFQQRGERLVKLWQSPSLSSAVRFGWKQTGSGGHQQVSLYQGDPSPPYYAGTASVFRLAGRHFLGWEAHRFIPPPPPPAPPPPPPPPTPEERLSFVAYDEGYGFRDPFLTLDERKIIQLHPTNDMINAFWRLKQDRKRLLGLARQRFPARRIRLRHAGGVWKVMAGRVAVEILTPADAKNAKKPLGALAQDWRKAVQTILRGLAASAPHKP